MWIHRQEDDAVVVVLGRACALALVGGTWGIDPQLPTVKTILGYVTLDLVWATYARNDTQCSKLIML
jgi:hypothetical protein